MPEERSDRELLLEILDRLGVLEDSVATIRETMTDMRGGLDTQSQDIKNIYRTLSRRGQITAE